MRTNALALVILLAGFTAGGCSTPDKPRVQSEAEEQGWAGSGAAADPGQIADGRGIAESQCAACHAIDARSNSPNPVAPPLRDVLAVNDPEALAYRFIDAMRVGHDEMPLFDFDVRAADALIAYIESISSR